MVGRGTRHDASCPFESSRRHSDGHLLPPQLDLNNDLDIRDPSVHTQARTWVTDYLIGCHMSDNSGLSVLVGSNECVFFASLAGFYSHSSARGDVALLRNADFYDRMSPWSLERMWTGHHKGVVRSALLDERVSSTMLLYVHMLMYCRPTSFSRGAKTPIFSHGRVTRCRKKRETRWLSTLRHWQSVITTKIWRWKFLLLTM